MLSACSIRVRGVVQGVGFRPFVYRLAQAHHLAGWVLNGEQGVLIFVEGDEQALDSFVEELRVTAPPASVISGFERSWAEPVGLRTFTIRESEHLGSPTVRVSPDLPVCENCIAELFDPSNPRHGYPYINCTNCGPRYSVILELPYDRPNTTMKEWPLDAYCAAEYRDPTNRRFHAQPVACPNCGPGYFLQEGDSKVAGADAIAKAARWLREGKILAVKGLGGYHLSCDAKNGAAVSKLRQRKYRKEKPFAVMVKDLAAAHGLVELSAAAEALLTGVACPIVLAPGRVPLPEVAPENRELGVMLPYTPLQHLLFSAGAPGVLVMTSANRSSEPIAYQDEEAQETLSGIADAFLVGQRPLARRVDDSVTRAGTFGPVVLRRARGYAPGAVAQLPVERPVLALGADLKNSVTLVVKGQAFTSQHIGDLEHYSAFCAFEQTIRDLLAMYEVRNDELLLAHDAHPQYRSTLHALKIDADSRVAVQHHRAHIASVLAERGDWHRRVLGVSFDGTGYGDDGTIWGGEIFTGSLIDGFERVAHLRPAVLAGGDAAAGHPVQAAAGFLPQIEGLPDLHGQPFCFPPRYRRAVQLVEKQVRTFSTTSVGRLFDAAAALLGFTRAVTFEGQAAMWLEQLAQQSSVSEAYPFPFEAGELDFRPLLLAGVKDRAGGRDVRDIARCFQKGVAVGLSQSVKQICGAHALNTVVLSGGVFQNDLLLSDLESLLAADFELWTNHAVPPNDGGISLGQAAMAAFHQS